MTPALLVFALAMQVRPHSRHIRTDRSAPNVFASMPCCAVESIDFPAQYVKVRDYATGREYNLRIDDAAMLSSIRVGSKVFAALRADAAPEYQIPPCCAGGAQ